MAAATGRLAIPGGGAWTAVSAGPFNAIVKADPGPDIEVYYGATASPPTPNGSEGLTLVSYFEPLNITLLAGDTLWARCWTRDTALHYTKQDS